MIFRPKLVKLDVLREAKDRIILALDVDSTDDALRLIDSVEDNVGAYKVGLQLLTRTGPSIFSEILQRFPGSRFFYDGKFHDIPNTVGNAVRNAAQIPGVAFISAHLSGGRDMLECAVSNRGNASILGITALTSLSDEDCRSTYNLDREESVLRFAVQAARAGFSGLVCSPNELAALGRLSDVENLIRVVPGIRPAWTTADDQKSAGTPAAAIRAGATYLVIGRPISNPPYKFDYDPRKAAQAICAEIDQAQAQPFSFVASARKLAKN